MRSRDEILRELCELWKHAEPWQRDFIRALAVFMGVSNAAQFLAEQAPQSGGHREDYPRNSLPEGYQIAARGRSEML